jgi:hypothetical protein
MVMGTSITSIMGTCTATQEQHMARSAAGADATCLPDKPKSTDV